MTDEDEPVTQYLKVVQVLRCAPGYTKKPAEGEPMVILTLSHNGEVEQPMMFRLSEAQKAQYGLLAALAYHGDVQATKIVAQFYKPRPTDDK